MSCSNGISETDRRFVIQQPYIIKGDEVLTRMQKEDILRRNLNYCKTCRHCWDRYEKFCKQYD